MTIGSQLANDSNDLPIPKISDEQVELLEKSIDRITAELPFKKLCHSRRTPLISHSHLARCVCRRAERQSQN